MAYAFDTLGYARSLENAGVQRTHAEAHAEAARDFVMSELVTKEDLRLRIDALDTNLRHEIANQALRTVLMLGGLIVACVGALAAFIKIVGM